MYSVWAYDYDEDWIVSNYKLYDNNRQLWQEYIESHDHVPYDSFRKHIDKKLNLPSRATITDEQLEWIMQNNEMYSCLEELAEAFNKRFGCNKSKDNMCRIKRMAGETRKPLPVGSVYQSAGYNRIKVGNGANNHIKYSRYVIEKKYGQLPNGYSVIHIDNDTLNDSIENLVAVPNEWLGTMQQYGWFSKDNGITKAGLMWLELKSALGNKRMAIGLRN